MKRHGLILFVLLSSFELIFAQKWSDEAFNYQENGKIREAINVYLQHINELSRGDLNGLAYCYEELEDYEEAIRWYKMSANKGNSSAMFNLGRLFDNRYGTHKGVVANKEVANDYYKQAIYSDHKTKGRSWSVLNLFLNYKDAGRLAECKPILEYAVREDVNLSEAPYFLAKYFYKGKESIYYYRIAAEHGEKYAQYELAMILQEGELIEKDLKEAAKWHRKAAEQGNWMSQEEIGKCYEELYLKTLDERYLKLCLKYYYNIFTDNNDSGAPRKIVLGDMSNIEVDKEGNWIVNAPENPLEAIYSKGLYGAKTYKTYEEWLNNMVKPLAIDSDVDINIPKNDIKTNAYVLIIANENYNYEHYVPYAENDGESVRKYFENTFGIPSSNIHLITDATLNKMKREIEWLVDNCKESNKLYLYYSGHGIPANDLSTAYLLPCDGYAKDPETGLNLNWLYTKLGTTNIPCYVFLDACFSGSGRGQRALVESKGVSIKPKEVVPQNKTIVISACQGTETAYPSEEQKHGLFTYFLLKKIQQNKGDVSLEALTNYLIEEVPKQCRKEKGTTQTPTVMTSKDISDIWKTMKIM